MSGSPILSDISCSNDFNKQIPDLVLKENFNCSIKYINFIPDVFQLGLNKRTKIDITQSEKGDRANKQKGRVDG